MGRGGGGGNAAGHRNASRGRSRLRRPTWRLILLVMTFSAGASLLAQDQPQQATSSLDPAAQQMLKQGEDALAARHYDEAEKGFKKANKIQHDMCVRCWFGLAQVRGG